MRNHIILAAIAVLACITAVAAIAGWSKSHNTAGKGQPTNAAAAPVSPHNIMVKQGNSLPIEYWMHPY